MKPQRTSTSIKAKTARTAVAASDAADTRISHPPVKLNLGCGYNKRAGYLNVDSSAVCSPDLLHDLESIPWPWSTSSVDEVVFYHSLEHMGATAQSFCALMQELYRVCKNGAMIHITVPHPRHENFLGDPTHVRIITPQVLSLFSKANCDRWKAQGASNTPLAHYLNVDFETVSTELRLDQLYASALSSGRLSSQEAMQLASERNNVAVEYALTLQAHKPDGDPLRSTASLPR